MNRDDQHEVVTDGVLEAAMADLRRDLPQDVDWDRLRRTINGKAEWALARRRASHKVYLPRTLVPLAAAAGVAFVLWMGPDLASRVVVSGTGAELATRAETEEILVRALGSDLSEQDFRLLVTGRADPEALLAVAIADR